MVPFAVFMPAFAAVATEPTASYAECASEETAEVTAGIIRLEWGLFGQRFNGRARASEKALWGTCWDCGQGKKRAYFPP